MPNDIQQYGVRNEYGDVFPASSESNAWFIAEQDPGLTVVSRFYTPWEPAPPPTDRKLVQSRRASPLPLVRAARYPRDALYALLRQATLDVDRSLAEQGLQTDSEYMVEVTVHTIARPLPPVQDGLRKQIHKTAATLDGLPPEIVADLTYRTSHGKSTDA